MDNATYQEIVKVLVEYEHTSVENLIISGAAVATMYPAAADLMYNKARARGYDVDAAPAEDSDVTDFHTTRYKRWLDKQGPAPEPAAQPEAEPAPAAEAEA